MGLLRARRCSRRFGLAAVGVALAVLLLALPASADLALAPGTAAQVAWTNGEGINLRSAPGGDSDIIASLPDGALLTIQGDSVTLDDGSSWYAVSADTETGALNGWVNADYLTGDGSAAADAAVEVFVDDSNSAADGVAIVAATSGATINIRSAPALTADVVGEIPDGASIIVLSPGVADGDGIAWSQVRYDGVQGYSATALLGAAAETALDVPVDVAVDSSGSSDSADGVATSALTRTTYSRSTATTDTTGAVIVSDALDFLGTPYVWGGTTPNGFDCSGFTYYVFSRVVDGSFPRPNAEQLALGENVAARDLLPGDLIFFQNTYQWGLSHVGIYLGNGQFVSASGEHNAVGISNLNDPYWSSRFLAARRVR